MLRPRGPPLPKWTECAEIEANVKRLSFKPLAELNDELLDEGIRDERLLIGVPQEGFNIRDLYG